MKIQIIAQTPEERRASLPWSLHLYKKRQFRPTKLSNSANSIPKRLRKTKMKQFFVRTVQLFLFLVLLFGGCHSGKFISSHFRPQITPALQLLQRPPGGRPLSVCSRLYVLRVQAVTSGSWILLKFTMLRRGSPSSCGLEEADLGLCSLMTIWTRTTATSWLRGCGSDLDLAECRREILSCRKIRVRTSFLLVVSFYFKVFSEFYMFLHSFLHLCW